MTSIYRKSPDPLIYESEKEFPKLFQDSMYTYSKLALDARADWFKTARIVKVHPTQEAIFDEFVLAEGTFQIDEFHDRLREGAIIPSDCYEVKHVCCKYNTRLWTDCDYQCLSDGEKYAYFRTAEKETDDVLKTLGKQLGAHGSNTKVYIPDRSPERPHDNQDELVAEALEKDNEFLLHSFGNFCAKNNIKLSDSNKVGGAVNTFLKSEDYKKYLSTN